MHEKNIVRNYGFLPQLSMHQWVVIHYEGLKVSQASHLGGKAVQLVVAQVQIQKVC